MLLGTSKQICLESSKAEWLPKFSSTDFFGQLQNKKGVILAPNYVYIGIKYDSIQVFDVEVPPLPFGSRLTVMVRMPFLTHVRK